MRACFVHSRSIRRRSSPRRVTENAAVLHYMARQFPEAELGILQSPQYVRLQPWLSVIGTERHEGTFAPRDRQAPEAVKTYTLGR